MKDFIIIANSDKEACTEFLNEAEAAIKRLGGKCLNSYLISDKAKEISPVNNYSDFTPDCEAVIVLGGDGTLLHAAKDLIGFNIPIIGVNFGTLGFLTEVEPGDFEAAVIKIIEDNYQIEERMLLKASVIRKKEIIKEDIALNDIVLTRYGYDIMTFDVSVNGSFLNTYSADGMIIASPTGSTGYNLSAGGPVVLPAAEIILATPLCAHTLNSRSIAFPANARIDLVVGKRRNKNSDFALLFDGEDEEALKEGDCVRIEKSRRTVRIIKINNQSFVETLGRKMR